VGSGGGLSIGVAAPPAAPSSAVWCCLEDEEGDVSHLEKDV